MADIFTVQYRWKLEDPKIKDPHEPYYEGYLTCVYVRMRPEHPVSLEKLFDDLMLTKRQAKLVIEVPKSNLTPSWLDQMHKN